MNINNKTLLIIILILLVIQAGLIVFLLQMNQQDSLSQIPFIEETEYDYANLPQHRAYFMRQEFYNEAYEQASSQIKKLDTLVYGGILPHHLIVKDKVAAFFEGIKDNKYETVVLIGPNHYEDGHSNVILSQGKWRTPYGEILPDLKLINQIKESTDFIIEEEPFIIEHSISGLVGFIKKSLPKVKIVPILLKYKTTEAEAEQLAQTISQNVNKNKTLVLASVDFSHFLGAEAADFHDLKSDAVIKNFDFERIYGLEVDSPASLYTVLKYFESIGSQKSELLFHTNSSRLTGQLDEPGTTHNLFYFTKGQKSENKTVNFLFFGDIMLDRNVGTIIKNNGLDSLFKNIAADENRFFMGNDITMANLEGAVTNNGAHYAPDMSIDFAFSPELITGLQKYDFNFFNLANNHLTDQGSQGVKETAVNLDLLNVGYSGCVDADVDDCSSKVIEVAGKKIGLVGLSMVYHDFDLAKAKQIISDLKSQSDLIIVNIHWGIEYQHQFNKKQQNVGHSLIDVGADIIIGHHPHVIQGMEIYNGKPIFYSLGNFIFDQYFSVETQVGLAIGFSTNFDKDNNKQHQIFLFPFKSTLSQPEFMAEEEKRKLFQNFINWSDVEEKYYEQILSGRIEL